MEPIFLNWRDYHLNLMWQPV